MSPKPPELPKKVLTGKNVLKEIAGVLKALNLSKPLVLADEMTRKVAGNSVMENLSGFQPLLYVFREDTLSHVEEIKKTVKNFECVISVGGGKIIDAGKLLAFQRKLPFVSVPTAPSHDGIASDSVSMFHKGKQHSIKAKPPVAIIADTGILASAPKRLIASGFADAVSNYVALRDWRLSGDKEYYSGRAASLSLFSAEIALNSAELIRRGEESGIRDLVDALITSGISMSLAGSSRPASGSEHLFSHALDMLCRDSGLELPLHGESCGIGAILMAHHQDQHPLFRKEPLFEKIRDALKTAGAPVTAKELGVAEDRIVQALLNARGIRKRYTILDEVPLSREKARELCRSARVF